MWWPSILMATGSNPADYTLKGKFFYGQEPPCGESVTTKRGFNYQLPAVIYWSSPMWSSLFSRPQPATDNGVRDGRSNWLVAPPTLHRTVPSELHVLHSAMRAANRKTCCTQWAANVRPSVCQANALPVRPLRPLLICIRDGPSHVPLVRLQPWPPR